MTCSLTEEELWSGLDRNTPEVAEHLTECPDCRSRAERLRAGMRIVSDAARPPHRPLPHRIGPYVICRRLGEGGMGIVYEGEQQSPHRRVAIKVIRGGRTADDLRVRLFQREAQTLAHLKHPAIAGVYEAGRTDEGQEFFAMELVRGLPLNQFVRQQDVPRRQRLLLFERICEAIHYAHQRGVIHRDIKPSNIFVDPDGNPKILDFGLARLTDPDTPLTTLVSDVDRLMGTLPYMSPEEARGGASEVDVRSDVYSLGIILFELLTDKLPYAVTRRALPEAIRVICEESPRKPSSIDRTLRGDLDTITLKALEKDLGRRYQSATLLAEDVSRHLHDQPIRARRGSSLYKLRKFAVRHRLLVIVIAAAVATVVAGRIWLDVIEQERRADFVWDVVEVQELRAAIIEDQLAEALHNAGRFDEAEPHYRNALATFERLGDDERAAPTLLHLGTLLLARKESTESDYEAAADFLEAAMDILERNPASWPAERRQALEALHNLFGPDLLDYPDALAEVQAALSALAGEERSPTDPDGDTPPTTPR